MNELKAPGSSVAERGRSRSNGRVKQASPSEAVQEAARLIRERRTIRSFAKRSVSGSELTALLRQAAHAVTLEHEADALRFLVFATEEGKRKAGAAIMSGYFRWMPGKWLQAMAERVAKIPAIVAVIRRESADEAANDRQVAAACAIVHSFTLLAWERKLGLTWNTDAVMEHGALTSGIGLAADERLVSLLYVGEYDKLPKGKRRTPAGHKWTVLGQTSVMEEKA